MPLLKDGRFSSDPWAHFGEDDDLPSDGDVTVPFARLAAHYEQLSARPGRLGVQLPNNERAEALRLFLPNLGLVILPFPAFTDGRAFSLARQIRGLGYRGELRASGAFLPDQLGFLAEVGFDSFAVTDRFPESAWARAASAISLSYQTIPGRSQIWLARHREPAAEPGSTPHPTSAGALAALPLGGSGTAPLPASPPARCRG
jgi:uncharacterized protein (DUF934 family)